MTRENYLKRIDDNKNKERSVVSNIFNYFIKTTCKAVIESPYRTDSNGTVPFPYDSEVFFILNKMDFGNEYRTELINKLESEYPFLEFRIYLDPRNNRFERVEFNLSEAYEKKMKKTMKQRGKE